jgi:uncharacterized protein YkwD
VERAVIAHINEARAAAGLSALRPSPTLERAADAHSAAMAEHGTLTHGSWEARLRGVTRARTIGETIGWMPTGRAVAAQLVRAWMASPPHRATLLTGAFRRVGVARRTAVVDGRRVAFFTADLAS